MGLASQMYMKYYLCFLDVASDNDNKKQFVDFVNLKINCYFWMLCRPNNQFVSKNNGRFIDNEYNQ